MCIHLFRLFLIFSSTITAIFLADADVTCSAEEYLDYSQSPFASRLRQYLSSEKPELQGKISVSWQSSEVKPDWELKYPFLEHRDTLQGGFYFKREGIFRTDLEFQSGTLSLLSSLNTNSFVLWTPTRLEDFVPTDRGPGFDGNYLSAVMFGDSELAPYANLFWPLTLSHINKLWSSGSLKAFFEPTDGEENSYIFKLNTALKPQYLIRDDGTSLEVEAITSEGLRGYVEPFDIKFENVTVNGARYPSKATSNLLNENKKPAILTQSFDYGTWGGTRLPKGELDIPSRALVFDPDAKSVSLKSGGPIRVKHSNSQPIANLSDDDSIPASLPTTRGSYRTLKILSLFVIAGILGFLCVRQFKKK